MVTGPENSHRLSTDGCTACGVPHRQVEQGGCLGIFERAVFRDERWTPSTESASGRCPRAADQRRGLSNHFSSATLRPDVLRGANGGRVPRQPTTTDPRPGAGRVCVTTPVSRARYMTVDNAFTRYTECDISRRDTQRESVETGTKSGYASGVGCHRPILSLCWQVESNDLSPARLIMLYNISWSS